MAKKSSSGVVSKKTNFFSLVQKVSNSVEMIGESVLSNITEWIDSGSYILNSNISGDMFKGFPGGRVSILAGESGCGKSYLACSVCRNAQKQGYKVIYIDSEAAITAEFVQRLGCNTDGDNFMIMPANTVNEVTTFLLNLCNAINTARAEGEDVDKVIIVLDSIGNLASDKEKADMEAGDVKQDMTRARELKKMFRLITVPLAKAGIPLIAVNHTYDKVGSYVPGKEQGGGSGVKYASTVTLFLTASKLEDKANDKAASERIGAGEVKKRGVKVSCTPEKSRLSIPHKVFFQIPFYTTPNPYTGLEAYLNWENAGIMLGKCLLDAEYQKLKPAEQAECIQFTWHNPETNEEEMRYAWPKKTMVRGVGIVCKHLGRAVDPTTEFWSSTVFTPEFLKEINEKIFRPEFELPSRESFSLADLEKDLGVDEDEDVD